MHLRPFRLLERFHLSDRELVRFLDPERKPDGNSRSSRHLRRCGRCRRELEAMESALRAFAMVSPAPRFEPVPAPWLSYWKKCAGLAAVACLVLALSLNRDTRVAGRPPVEAPLRQEVPTSVAAVRPPVTRALPSVPGPAPARDSFDWEATEIEVRHAVHTACECLGKPLAVTRRKGKILVEGVVADFVRRDAVAAALKGMPRVELRVLTIEESAESRFFPCGPKPGTQAGETAAWEAGQARQLVAYFSPAGQGAAHSMPPAAEHVLLASRTAALEARALRGLVERYPPGVVKSLPSSSRLLLGGMFRDYLTRLESHAALWRELEAAAMGQLATIPQRPALAERPAPPVSWRAEFVNLVQAVDKADAVTRRLLSRKAPDPPELVRALAEMHAALAGLDLSSSRAEAGLGKWISDSGGF